MIRETYIFDGLIALVAGGVPAYLAHAYTRKSGKRPIGPVVAGLGLLWGVVVYGSFVAPRSLVVREYDATVTEGGAHTMSIAVISDTHLGQYRDAAWLEKVVARTNAAQPDLVLLAGDLVSDVAGLQMLSALKKIEAPYGAYAVLGNWDYRAGGVDVRRAVESQRVEVLTNESVVVGPADAPLRIAGLDDVRFGKPDIDKALAVDADVPTILLAHNPDAVRLAESRGVPLTFAGHTHAGQVRLPWVGPVPELPTRLGRAYDKGVFEVGPGSLFITPGVGESGTRARLFNPPEISIVHVTY